MIRKSVSEFTFKKKDTFVQINDKAGVSIDGETVKIDHQLLFQRLVSAAHRTKETELSQLVSYELCTHPPALFETQRLIRAADKPALANAMTRGPRGPWVAHLRKRSKVTVELLQRTTNVVHQIFVEDL